MMDLNEILHARLVGDSWLYSRLQGNQNSSSLQCEVALAVGSAAVSTNLTTIMVKANKRDHWSVASIDRHALFFTGWIIVYWRKILRWPDTAAAVLRVISLITNSCSVFTARWTQSGVMPQYVCLSVCLSVCDVEACFFTQVRILQK